MVGYSPWSEQSADIFITPGIALVKINTASTIAFPGGLGTAAAASSGMCRALLVGTAGNATIYDATRTICVSVPLQQGYNPIMCSQMLSSDLTASNMWAIY